MTVTTTTKIRWGVLAAVCAGAVGVGGCSSSKHTTPPGDLGVGDLAPTDQGLTDQGNPVDLAHASAHTYNYRGTIAGQGDVVDITIDHDSGSLSIVDVTSGHGSTFVGTVTSQPSGFVKATITNSCAGADCALMGDGGPAIIGSTAHVVEAPGYFVIIIPDGSPGAFLGVAARSCTPGVTGGFTLVDTQAMGDITQEGVISQATLAGGPASGITVSGTTYALNSDGGVQPSAAPTTGSCAGGVIDFPDPQSGGNDTFAVASDNGAALVFGPTTPQQIGFAGTPALSALEGHRYTVFLSNFGAADVIQNGQGLAEVTFPAGSATGTGFAYASLADVDSNSTDSNSALSVTWTDSKSGVVTGSIAAHGTTSVFQGAALVGSNGINTMVVIGYTGGDSTAPFVALFTSQQ